MRAALGFSIHTGWAAAVALSDQPALLARRRVELAGADHDARFVYHAAAEHGRAAERIRKAETIARERAQAALSELLRDHAVAIAAVPPPKRALPALEIILASHPLLHAAEGELYRRAIVDACLAAGLEVVTPAPRAPTLGKVGPPWGKDQKAAAALAWAALRAHQR
jgi:hypothetical protein